METSRSKSKRYENTKLALSILDFLLSFIFINALWFFRWNEDFANLSRDLTDSPYLAFLVFAGITGVLLGLLTLPVRFYSGFWLEHRYGLSNQSFPAWMWHQAKGAFVSLAISLPLALIFYFLLRQTGDWWWLWLGVVLFVFSVVLAQLAPILIFPLFYRFEPLEDENLVSRIRQLCQRVGLRVSAVFRFNLSKTTRKANAGFTGLGKTKRVILSDTLLDHFNADEIETVFAHELGHFHHRHIRKLLVMGFLFTFAGLFIARIAYSRWTAEFGYSLDQLEALPLLAVVLAVYGLVTTPVQNAISRHYERQADIFAVKLSGKADAFVSALEKLAEINLADREPHPVVEFLFYSHPSIAKRLALVRNLQHIQAGEK